MVFQGVAFDALRRVVYAQKLYLSMAAHQSSHVALAGLLEIRQAP